MKKYTNAQGQIVRVQRPERHQQAFHWESLDELLPEKHFARDVWAYVEGLDLSAFYRDLKAVEGNVGRDGVDPAMLLALWLLAIVEGVGGARQLDRLCKRDLVYQWMLGGVTVNHTLLADFFTHNEEELDALLVDSIAVLLQQRLVSLDRVAQDGMRVRASAGKDTFHREATLKEHLQAAGEAVAKARQEYQAGQQHPDQDQRGPATRKRVAEQRQARVEKALEQVQKLRAERAQLPPSQQAKKPAEPRASATDPEARMMQMADRGYRPGYNVQLATTCGTRLIVGVDVTNQGSDSGQMTPMLDRIQRRFARQPEEVIVDGGFSSRADTTEVERRGIKVYAPIKCEEKLLRQGKDPYARQRGDTDEYYAFRQRMKLPESKEIYKDRCSTAEFANAGFRNRGLEQFQVRGTSKARIIALWHAHAHNFRMILTYGWLPHYEN